MRRERKTLYLAVRDFDDEERASLRSTLAMVKPWLKADWRLIHGGRADVLLGMGQGGEVVHESGTLVVSCLSTPGKNVSLNLRWPLHAAQLLALLNGCQQRGEQNAAKAEPGERYELRIWPRQFVEWPAEWWRVLAALSRRPHSLEEIAVCTALSDEQIRLCLAELGDNVVMACTGQAATVPACRSDRVLPGWRRIAARISQALGVA